MESGILYVIIAIKLTNEILIKSHALEKMLKEIIQTVRFGYGGTKGWLPATYQINGINDCFGEDFEENNVLKSLLNQELPLDESTINEIFNDFELPFNQDTLNQIKPKYSRPEGNQKKLIALYTFLLEEQSDFKLNHAKELKKKVNSVLDSIVSTYEEAINFLNSKEKIKEEQLRASKDSHEKDILEIKFTALGSISKHLERSKDLVIKRYQDTIATLDIEDYPSVSIVRSSLSQEFVKLQAVINNDEFKNNPKIGDHISWKGKLLNLLVNIITFFQKDYVADTKASINFIVDSSKRKIFDELNPDNENNSLKP